MGLFFSMNRCIDTLTSGPRTPESQRADRSWLRVSSPAVFVAAGSQIRDVSAMTFKDEARPLN